MHWFFDGVTLVFKLFIYNNILKYSILGSINDLSVVVLESTELKCLNLFSLYLGNEWLFPDQR